MLRYRGERSFQPSGINFGATEKFFAETLYFSPSHDLPLEGDFKKNSESTRQNRQFFPLT